MVGYWCPPTLCGFCGLWVLCCQELGEMSLEDEAERWREIQRSFRSQHYFQYLMDSSSTLLLSCDHLRLLTTGPLHWGTRGGGGWGEGSCSTPLNCTLPRAIPPRSEHGWVHSCCSQLFFSQPFRNASTVSREDRTMSKLLRTLISLLVFF